MYKKVNVVMLPTNEKANISINKNGKMFINSFSDTVNYNLYITSDDKIKKGDWLLPFQKDMFDRIIPYQYKEGNAGINDKKIIATTDSSLSPKLHKTEIVDDSYPKAFHNIVPQIPQQFIEHFVSEYNKGNVITDVLVEYVEINTDYRTVNYPKPDIKINPKDNTITIKKVKDSWSREEVKTLFLNCNKELRLMGRDRILKWIEENL